MLVAVRPWRSSRAAHFIGRRAGLPYKADERAIAEQHSLTSISLHGVIDVAFYAVVSASVGYCVKVAWDTMFKRYRNRNTKGQ